MKMPIAYALTEETKGEVLMACVLGLLMGCGAIAVGLIWFSGESAPYRSYDASTQGRVIKASQSIDDVRPNTRAVARTIYSTVASFEVDGKTYEAEGKTDCSWFVPKVGEPAQVVYVSGDPMISRVRYELSNEHNSSFLLMGLGISCICIMLFLACHTVRGKPLSGCAMPREWQSDA